MHILYAHKPIYTQSHRTWGTDRQRKRQREKDTIREIQGQTEHVVYVFLSLSYSLKYFLESSIFWKNLNLVFLQLTEGLLGVCKTMSLSSNKLMDNHADSIPLILWTQQQMDMGVQLSLWWQRQSSRQMPRSAGAGSHDSSMMSAVKFPHISFHGVCTS